MYRCQRSGDKGPCSRTYAAAEVHERVFGIAGKAILVNVVDSRRAEGKKLPWFLRMYRRHGFSVVRVGVVGYE